MQDLSETPRVVVSSSDMENISAFFKKFNLPMPERLQVCVDSWGKNGTPTYQDQEKFKVELCRAFVTSNHEMFTHEKFQPVMKSLQEVVFKATFKEELEEAISVPAKS